MKYRGLTYDKSTDSYKWVYGLPSYGFETEEIAEIGTPQGGFLRHRPSNPWRGNGLQGPARKTYLHRRYNNLKGKRRGKRVCGRPCDRRQGI